MIDYQNKLQESKVLEALREIGIPVADDWDNYYPIDKICSNIMNNSETILNSINSDNPNLELSFIKDDINNFFSFIFFKTKNNAKLGYLEISIRYNDENIISRFIQLSKINQDEPSLFTNLMMLAEGTVLNLMRLPLSKDYIKPLIDKDEKYINAIKTKFNYPDHDYLLMDGEEEMLEKQKKTYIKLLENSNPRLAKLIKEIIEQ